MSIIIGNFDDQNYRRKNYQKFDKKRMHKIVFKPSKQYSANCNINTNNKYKLFKYWKRSR